VLDIGGDVGALVIKMPHHLEGAEIEIRPVPPPAPSVPLRHVVVVARPVVGGFVNSAVFDALPEGRYDLHVRPDGLILLSAEVRAGAVTFADWPG
jgi:hypothetical protein